MVSHDRDFLDKLTTSLIVLEGDGDVREYVGGYSDYLRQRDPRSEKTESRAPKKAAVERPRTAPTKLTYKDARALELLPGEIASLEGEIAQLGKKLGDAGLFARDPDAFTAAAARLDAARGELVAKEERWLELEARREEIEASGG